MLESVDQVNEYLDRIFAYGPFWVYLVIWLACFIENVFPPFPGDTFILAGGALVALGRLEPGWLMLMVNTGGMLSVIILYVLGRRFGHDYFMKKDFKYFSAEDVRRMEARLARSGAWILGFSRFIFGVRSALAISAGIGRYPLGRTILYSLISYLAFSGLLIYVAITLVENLDLIEYYMVTYNSIVWPVVVLGLGYWVFRRFRELRRRRAAKRKTVV